MAQTKSNKKLNVLKKGDFFNISAISSKLYINDQIIESIKLIETWGLICISDLNELSKREWNYLAGTDQERFQDLHNKKISNLTVFACGGWGAARLLEKFQPWRNQYMLGFSDLTSVLLSRLSAGFDGGIHGPLLSTLSAEPDWSKERIKSILFGRKISDLSGDIWVKGISRGPLIVGNLTIICSLIGTSHIPDFQGSILILEETNEEPYRIDRMLTQLRLAGILKKVSGLGFGNFNCCIHQESSHNNSLLSLENIIIERCFDLKIPIIGNLPIGHLKGNAAMPIGRQTILDGFKGKIIIED